MLLTKWSLKFWRHFRRMKTNYYEWPAGTRCRAQGLHTRGLLWAQIPHQTLTSEPWGLSKPWETSRTAVVRWSRLESYHLLVNEDTSQEGAFFRLLRIFTCQAAGQVYSHHLMAWFLVSEVERRELRLSNLLFEPSFIEQATFVELLKRKDTKPPKHMFSFEKSNSHRFLWHMYGSHILCPCPAPILQASSKTLKTCTN